MQDEYNSSNLRLWRRTETRTGVPPFHFWREGYTFEGCDVGNDMVQECAANFQFHARSKLELAATPEQHAALVRKFEQDSGGLTRPEFMAQVQPTFGLDEAVVVPWCGMWLCVETDGYTHT